MNHNCDFLQLATRLMKWTLIQWLLIAFTFGVGWANPGSAQELMERRITLSAEGQPMRAVFRTLEEQTGTRFMYRQQLLSSDRRVNLRVTNERLGDVLDKLLKPLSLQYELLGKRILITRQTPDSATNSTPNAETPADPLDQTISGKVTDENGNGMPGVSIVLKGTQRGTTSNPDGNYSIAVPNGNTTLVFSFVGYLNREEVVGNRSSVNVTMAVDNKSLNEVVIVGYGSQKQKEVTTAIVSIKEESFNKGNISNPAQLLQGKVPGLTVARVGGDPNQPFVVRMRGLATFGANSEPLIIIDGLIGASLNSLDPNDIESIEVLKDASAGAIYGTRASSGVIIITTKSGSTKSKPVVEYNGFVSAENISNTIRVATPDEFIKYGGRDFGSRTNWLDEVSGTGLSNVHNLAVSNRVGGLNYRASINYRQVNGVLNGTGFNQLNGRLNISQKLLNDKLTLSAIASNTTRKADIGFAQSLRYTLNFNPTAPVYKDNDPTKGFLETNVQDVFNPVALNSLNSNIAKTNTQLANFIANYQITDGLSVNANYSYQTSAVLNGQYIGSQSIFGIPNGVSRSGIATRGSSENTNELFELTGTYKGGTDKINYTLLGGYSWNQLDFDSFSIQNTGFITDAVTFNNLGLGLGIRNNLASTGSNREEARLISFFGRANVSIADAYFLTASLRREGSSRFGANNRWGNFWAVSGGVQLTDIFKMPAFTSLKVRAGYGVTGNLPFQNYAYLETLGAGSLGFINGNFVPAIGPTSNPNPNLKWEQKGEFNAGVDFALFKNALSGSVDYFTRNTNNLLNVINVPSPPNIFGSSLVNLGELKTTGLEFSLDYRTQVKAVKWNIGLNYSSYITTLIKFNEQENSVLYQGNVGAPGLNNTFIVKVADGERIGQLVAQPFVRYNEKGQAVMLDKEGKETLVRDRKDFVTIGNGLPKFSMGLNNSFAYKNLDFNIFLRGVFGHSLANINRAYFEHPANAGKGNIVVTRLFDAADKETEAWHSGYIEKADFVRADNATLGYTFSLKPTSAVKLLRFYVTAQNLFTITKYTGSDPEPRYFDPGPISAGDASNTYSGNILAPGIDTRVSYFPTRTLLFGVNLNF